MKGMDDSTPLNRLVASEIRAWLGRRQLTGRQLAAKIGASQTWTSTRLRGEQEITLNDLQRIAAALDVEISELLPAPARRGTEGTGGSRLVDHRLPDGPRSIRLLGHPPAPPGQPTSTDRTGHRGDDLGHTRQPPPTQRADHDRPRRPSWTHAR